MTTFYIRCSKCGHSDLPVKPLIKEGRIVREYNVGTSTLMRCADCSADGSTSGSNPYATMCRACCPTGHGTRPILDDSEVARG